MTQPKIERAGIYIRVSTEQQRHGAGLSDQQRACERYAAELGYQVVGVYADEGISGAHRVAFRDGLDRLLADMRAGKIDVMLVYEFDRLARDLGVGMEIVVTLMSANKKLVAVATRTVFSDHGALMGLVQMWTAGEDRKRILVRTKMGHIHRAKEGKVAGAPPLGYDRTEDGRLVINEAEAELVRRIYRMYLEEGYHYESIAVQLNNEGVKTNRARLNETGKYHFRGADRWQRSTIQCIFRNPVYKGEYVYGKTRGKVWSDRDYQPSAKRPVTKAAIETALKNRAFVPHEEVVVPVPAIVDVETWEKANRVRAERYERSYLAKEAGKFKYNFTGIVRCQECGRVMMRTTIERPTKTKGVKEHPYYVCRNRDIGCSNAFKSHHLDVIDGQIMIRLLPYLQDPERVRRTLTDAVADRRTAVEAFQRERTAAVREIADLEAEVRQILNGYAKGVYKEDEAARDRAERDAKIEEAKARIADLDRQLGETGLADEEERLALVVGMLSQPGFTSYDDGTAMDEDGLAMTLSTMFSNRVAAARKHYYTPRLTVIEYIKRAIARPTPDDDDDDLARRFLDCVQRLVKRVTIDTEGRIVDYVLWIDPGPTNGPTGTGPSIHSANLNSITKR